MLLFKIKKGHSNVIFGLNLKGQAVNVSLQKKYLLIFLHYETALISRDQGKKENKKNPM